MLPIYGKFNVKHKIDWKVDWTGIASIDDTSCIVNGRKSGPVNSGIIQHTVLVGTKYWL